MTSSLQVAWEKFQTTLQELRGRRQRILSQAESRSAKRKADAIKSQLRNV